MGKPAISRPAPAVGYADGPEEFLWDGLALVRRGSVGYLNEPHANGGSPLLSSGGGVLFNDLLGSTLGTLGGDGYKPFSLTAFGDTEDKSAFFTGKPQVEGLGYAFLLRNYRPDHGKWLTAAPLGYPDGWNNLAYCNNFIDTVDFGGGLIIKILDKNNNYQEVLGEAALTYVEADLSSQGIYGSFEVTFRSASIDPITHEATIEYAADIQIQAGLTRRYQCPINTVVTYLPHCRSNGQYQNASPGNPFKEMIRDHEYGHAISFFDFGLPALRNALNDLELDDGTKTLEYISIIADIKRGNILSLISCVEASGTCADTWTCASFGSDWEMIEIVNEEIRWKKVSMNETE